MKRRRLFWISLPLFWAPLWAASNALPYRPLPPSWQTALDRFEQKGAIPGAVVVLRSPEWGVRVGVTGYADVAARRAMSPDLPFRVGSVSKMFTAQVVLVLEQQGRLRLTDPVMKYLADNPDVAAIPHIARVKVADCLQMKTGIPNYVAHPTIGTSPDVSPGRQFTPSELLRVLAPGMSNPLKAEFAPGETYPNPYWVAFMGPGKPAPPDFPPFAWWDYSNSNYTLLGLIIEKVVGIPLQDAIERTICRPLGLADTTFPVDLTYPANMMRGYTRLDALRNPRYSEWKDVTDVNPSYAWAAGAVISTPWDLLHFIDRILKSDALLNKGTRQKWLTFVSADIHWPDVEYGMGGIMQGQRPYGDLRGHGGAYPGYKTIMYQFPDSDMSLIIASNTWDGHAEVDMMDAIMTMAAAAPAEPRAKATTSGATLAWQPGRTYGDRYTIYWGTQPDAVEAGGQGVAMKNTEKPGTTIGGLTPDTTYYWRVETVSQEDGRITGPLWRFRTAKRAH